MTQDNLISRAADYLLESLEQHDPETEQALDYLEQQGVLTRENRDRVRQLMMQAMQRSGGDVRKAIQTVQASNKRLVGDIEREHGQQLAHPQLAPHWQKVRSFYQ